MSANGPVTEHCGAPLIVESHSYIDMVTGHLGSLLFRPRDAVDVQAARIDTNPNGLLTE